MIKKCMSFLFLVSIGLPLYGMNNEQKTKKTIYSLEQLKQEVGRTRQEYSKNKEGMLQDVIRKGRVDHNPVITVDIHSTDSEKK